MDKVKFKFGDKICFKECKANTAVISKVGDIGYYCEDGMFIHFDNQNLWELVEEPVTKFKVGDNIRHKTLKIEGTITNISDSYAIDVNCGVYEEFGIKVSEWELVEEPESEDLEKAAIEYCGGNKGSDARVRTGFIMGAEWQKQQMMAKAISTSVEGTLCGLSVRIKQESLKGFSFGNKVKVIIIKED